MKKILCLILTLAMLIPGVGVFADAEASGSMQEVLLEVKSKITVPEELSKFTPQAMENPEKGTTFYRFTWEKEEGGSYIEVTSDEKGRISNYYAYDSSRKSTKKLTDYTPSDIADYAGEFLKKIAPEAFGTDDELVHNDELLYVNNLNYSLTFSRMYNGIEVNNNYANIRIQVFDDEIFVRSMSLAYDYDAQFSIEQNTIEDYNSAYNEVFPVELIYTDEYSYNSKDKKTALVYRRKDGEDGYILASDGKKAVEDAPESELYRNEAMKEMASDSMAMGGLTKEEIAGLETVEGLISRDDVRRILKKLPYTKLTDTMKCDSFDIYVTEDVHTVSVSYSSKDGKRIISATLDGMSGDIRNLYNSAKFNSDIKLTESKKKSGYTSMDKFLEAAASDKIASLNPNPFERENADRLTRRYDRQVNGIRYISDGIDITYDVSDGIVTNFSVDFEDDREFRNPEGIVSLEDGTKSLFKTAPLKKIYIKSDGKYRLCYTPDKYSVMIDAFTGEEYIPYGQSEITNYSYADIDNHWAKDKINKLSEAQIGFGGEKFRPDDEITLYDLLRLFAAGIKGRYYLDYSEEELYRLLENDGVITKEDIEKENSVTREDAFVYMIRLDGIEKVAKLSYIFTVSYEDAELISEGMIGYPAILTGMGIICGNGGKLRPMDSITRAEAAVMVYNYMMK